LCFPLLSVNTLTIGGVVGGVLLETNSVPPLRARKSTPTKMKRVQNKISATKRVNREVKEKKKFQNVMVLTRNALKTRGGTIALVVNDDDDDYHPSDSDADIVDTTTEITKVGLSLTKELLAKSPRKESIDLDDCVEVLVEDAANRLIEGKPYPNEVVINPMSTSLKTEDTSSTLSGLSLDTTFYKVIADAHVESFAEIDHIEPLVEIYEQKTGNHLRIKRSINGKFCVYQCREHIDCPFEIRVSRRKRDGMYAISRMKTRHAEVRRAPLAADGRKWKTRWSSTKLNNAITKVLKTKHVAPTPQDIIKTMANKKNDSQVVSYITAWRAINCDSMATKRLGCKSFQLVGPYIEELTKSNPGSVLGCTRLQTYELQSIHFIPGFMNNALKFVRPVISLDAAHLRSEFKGTLYVASVLTGNNDVFPIG
jgi:hypothetical protein